MPRVPFQSLDSAIAQSCRDSDLAPYAAEGNFDDHNGTAVPYRVALSPDDASLFVCSIDPHLRGEYTSAGSGTSVDQALQRAQRFWAAYDQAP